MEAMGYPKCGHNGDRMVHWHHPDEECEVGTAEQAEFIRENTPPMCGLPHTEVGEWKCDLPHQTAEQYRRTISVEEMTGKPVPPCECDMCDSYGESQAGKSIHFVSKAAELEFYAAMDDEDDDWEPPVDDPTSPDHYRLMEIPPTEYIMANNISWCEANVIKYVSRWRSKNGIEDLKKARKYLDILIESEENV